MSWDLVISIVSKVAEFFIDPVGRQIGYVFNYNTNINNLNDQTEKLKSAKERVQIDVGEAMRNGDEIYPDVLAWLKSVDGVAGQAEQIAKDKEDRAKTKCFNGWCPNLKIRYKLSKKAKKQTQVAVETEGKGKFEKVSHRKLPQVIRPVRGFEAFESRALVWENIMEALKDADVNLIGVYGMSGVGKTTIVNEVAFRVKEEGMFKSVVMVTVTHQLNVKNIQQEIAEKLDFKIDGEFVDVQAARLSRRIEGEEKILVILDDIWEAIKLEKVGIPYGKQHKGCKILMTSRDQNVFLEMDVQKDFRLEILSNKEAWNLFEKKVGGFKDSKVKFVANDVAERCLGLPVLIETVASALKSKELFEWNDALEKLKSFDHEGIQDRVHKALELSYDFLGPDEKSLFCLCGQILPHDIPIQDLLKYSMGLDLFKHCSSVKIARQRLLKVISALKRCCLLLEGEDEDRVRMHDAVHSFALSAAIKDHRAFIIPYGTELDEWPEEVKFKESTAISFPYCKRIPEFPEVFECPNLSSFIFYNDYDPSVRIPGKLFNRMKGLKLLDLSDVHLSPLPCSLQDLENLQTLCLDRCVLEEIAVIEGLKKLQVLSLTGSSIIQLPEQVGNLTRLQLLDLSGCEKLEVIPAGVLSRLTRLEELYMRDSFVRWEEEGHTGTSNHANLGELKLLSNLAVLEMQVMDAKLWPGDMFFENLEKFKIFIGENWSWSGQYETSKTLKLQINTSNQLRKVRGLLKRSEDVYLDDMKGVKGVLYDLDDQGFPEMKHLHVRNSPDIQYIMDCTSMFSSHVAFPKLESLSLDYLLGLEKICYGTIKEASFSGLRKLNVRNCDKMKNVFSSSMIMNLMELNEIYVSSCKTMEEIVVKEKGDDSENDEEIELTQLCRLTLENLPRLTSFNSLLKVSSIATTRSSLEVASTNEPETPAPLFSRKIILPKLEELKLFSIEVEKIWSKQLMEQSQCIQRLTILTVDGCGNLNYLFTYSMIQSLVQLKNLEICDCKSMEEIIATSRGGSGEETMGNILFPKLELLKLKSLPKLIRFCTTNTIECPSLKVVCIKSCDELKKFTSGFTSHNGEANPSPFDEKVAFHKLEKLHIHYMNNLKMIWHDGYQVNSLKVLMVGHANKILKVCESGNLQNLESVVVNNCDLVELVFDDHIQVAPIQLRTLELKHLPNLRHIWKWKTVAFEKLSSMTICYCWNLKSLFPLFVAKSLRQLKKLEIRYCGLEYIVSKEEIAQTTLHFTFPRLQTLYLEELQDLKSFYSDIHTLDCPALQKLVVYHCDQLKIFYSEQEDMQEISVESLSSTQDQQPLFSFREVVPNLDELGLNSKETKMIEQDQFTDVVYDKLKTLDLQCFYDTTSTFPFYLLHKFRNVDDLVISHCYFKEIAPSSSAEEHANMLSQILYLRLELLPEMRQILNQDCQLGQLLQNLESLEVWECHALKNLASSFTSFYNLTALDVWGCEGLINLVTTSTAKGMVNLTTMAVSECKSMTEIVINEGDESQSCCEIIFYKLTSLELINLSSLTCFSPSVSCIIKFPSLKDVTVTQCPKMKVFCQGVINSPRLEKVHITEDMDKWRWTKDLNTTIQHLHAEMNAKVSPQE